MKDRKPFELKNALIIYNIVQVILSVVLVFEVSNATIGSKNSIVSIELSGVGISAVLCSIWSHL